MKSKVICFANQKGGVAKSTSCINTGSALKKKGKRVLYVDMDPQADTTDGLGIDADSLEETIYDVLKGTARAEDVILSTDRGDVLAGSIEMSTADLDFNVLGKEHLLQKAISSVRENYDYVLVDTPPTLGFSTIASLSAADWLVVPCSPSKWSNKALTKLFESVSLVREYTKGCNLKIAGVLVTMTDSRTNNAKLNEELSEIIAESMRIEVFHTKIPYSVRVNESVNDSSDLLESSRLSKPAIAYSAFADELMERIC